MNSYTQCILQKCVFHFATQTTKLSYLPLVCLLHRGSYMHVHVLLLNITNELGEDIKWEACQTFCFSQV